MVTANTYPQIAAGDDITADLLSKMLPRIIVKPSATSRTSTTTLADDPDLSMALEANATYFVEFFLYYNGDDTGRFKTIWTVPSGSTGNRGVIGEGSTVTTATNADNVLGRFGVHAYGTSVVYGTRNSANQLQAYESGVIITTSSGNVTLQWAQNSSSTTATTLNNTSLMRVTRLA